MTRALFHVAIKLHVASTQGSEANKTHLRSPTPFEGFTTQNLRVYSMDASVASNRKAGTEIVVRRERKEFSS